ncbi:MAG: hypothetical protein JO029_09900 [Candidatus Eremiobacteraeota bacterium]|nr:hypothetical protein [Candidatus Eremiobacteraeota bacterium]MBV8434578.1 hypothetical protein [Candidatus Eremiobacteraeota bacterium]MBV8655352.1 hypothetical protein [Candidatus Eremiobacteraeota bacterium]MBV8722693.1 hypothetical protein [Candidatus Eremiobacteraeota bacterium]
MKRSTRALAGFAAATLLAACNNNNNGGVSPTPGPGCGNPPYNMEVLYPKPNAPKVPPTAQVFYVAVSQALPSGNQYDFWVVPSTGSPQYSVNQNGQPVINQPGSGFFSVNASQIPFPHANPTFSNPQYYATGVPYPIGPLTTVNLVWNDYGTGCNPNVIVSSFSTK